MNRKLIDSGIEWIGKIPLDWNFTKIKNLCEDIFSGGTPSTTELAYWENGDIPWIPSGSCHDCYIDSANKFITVEGLNHSSTRLIKQNTALIAMTGATCGNTGYLLFESCANQSVTAYIEKKSICNSKYLWFALIAAREYILSFRNGGAQGGINGEVCKNLIIPFPSLAVQNEIVNIIENKISKIDLLIANQEKQIEKIKEQKKSIITDVVTKGLDKNKSLKDSGIEWIGKIPVKWNIVRIKDLLDKSEYGIKCGPFGSSLTGKVIDNGKYFIYGQWNIVGNDFSIKRNTINESSFNSLESYIVEQNDILVSMMGTIGKCSIVPSDINKGIMDSHVIKIRLNRNLVDPYYFALQYDKDNGNVVYEFYNRNKKGFIMDGLNTSIIKNAYFILPPLKDQLAIVKKCNEIDARIKALIDMKKNKIETLQEYKRSLIYEYVTGKKEA